MSTLVPVGSTIIDIKFVVLPFQGANQLAGQVLVETSLFVTARDYAIAYLTREANKAARLGRVITEAGRPVIVECWTLAYPADYPGVGGHVELEVRRDTLTDGVIDAAKRGI